MHIAIIGAGEVGRCYAAALHEHTDHIISLCDIHPTPPMHALAEHLGTELHHATREWIAAADTVLVCVPGSAALDVNLAALQHLQPGAVLIDTTTASPQHKREAADAAQAREVRLADVAIMGLIASTGASTPLLCAGNGSDRARTLLESIDAPIRVLDGAPAGEAISLKLLRSIITKGLEALAVESLVAAEKLGVREQLYEVLSDMDRVPVRDFVNTLVRTHVIHARRRQHEVREAQEQLHLNGLASQVLPGVEALFASTGAALPAHPLPSPTPTVDEVIAWLLQVREEAAGEG